MNAIVRGFKKLIEEALSPEDYVLYREGEDGLVIALNMAELDEDGFCRSRRFKDEEAINDLFEAMEAESTAVEMMPDGTEYMYFHESCYVAFA